MNLVTNLAVTSNYSTGKQKKGRQLIGVNGNWYDVSSFIKHHPGGQIIERFIGKDASSVFHAFHKPSVLQSRKPVSAVQADQDEMSQDFLLLGNFFEKSGYYEIDVQWYLMKISMTFAVLLASFTCVICLQDSQWKYAGAVALAGFWQQSGFLMHDAEHNLITKDRHVDSWLGTIFATVCFGVNGLWWRNEHFVHHALTACVDYETDFFDPQMKEYIWTQNKKLWPFFFTRLQYYCIKIQHWTFIPVCIFIGRIGIMIDSMMDIKRSRELIAFSLHWMWVWLLLSWLPNYQQRLAFYAVAAFLQGILHIQLLISHYSKSFHYLKELGSNVSWYQMQVESNIDIINPWWMDWFHGGLNFHLVHHLYPRMPRYKFRAATPYVKELCMKYGLEYDSCGWLEAIYRTLCHLKLQSQHFSLDPR